MRRILTGFVVAALAAVVPGLATAGNQETAEQVAQNLRKSGQMSDYKIGVKVQDGTASLRGHVTDEEQMSTALKLAFKTPGVSRVVNELTVAPAETDEAVEPSRQVARSSQSPQRGRSEAASQKTDKGALVKRLESMITRGSGQADRVGSSYTQAEAENVSAEEYPDVVPEQMVAPQRARPMAPNYVAMQQGSRGPVAPNGGPMAMHTAAANSNVAPARYDQPCMPNYAWPSYAAYPNYAAVTYPKQYSPTAWPYIGPFYPYPQVPLGWRKVTLEWDDGWWFLDFKDQPASCWHR